MIQYPSILDDKCLHTIASFSKKATVVLHHNNTLNYLQQPVYFLPFVLFEMIVGISIKQVTYTCFHWKMCLLLFERLFVIYAFSKPLTCQTAYRMSHKTRFWFFFWLAISKYTNKYKQQNTQITINTGSYLNALQILHLL